MHNVHLTEMVVIQSDLIIRTNDTAEYSTSDQNVLGTDLFLSKFYCITKITLTNTESHSWGQISILNAFSVFRTKENI